MKPYKECSIFANALLSLRMGDGAGKEAYESSYSLDSYEVFQVFKSLQLHLSIYKNGDLINEIFIL